MANSNRDAAIRLFTHTKHGAVGSNMYIGRNTSANLTQFTAGFAVHSTVASYRTTIATLMLREQPDDNGRPVYELWTTQERYSPTTDRHMHWVKNALYMHNSHSSQLKPFTDMRGSSPLDTGAIAHYRVLQQGSQQLMLRHNPLALRTAQERARRYMYEATIPRIHDKTRVTRVQLARDMLAHALFNATDGIDPATDCQPFADYAETVDAARAQCEFLTGLLAMPVTELRAAVEAVHALDGH